ncbi:3'-5' exoribonuclease YhaM family protein [Desulfovibrio sp. SGI.082]|jgi:3'-5' exoribonuclease|uniref:HD domain-containing protein n=2 Tax=Desulfovibrio TaxID=872 RepID=A0A848CEJ4_9BACT|nr:MULTISPECIES: HD domain-containing protein [Desulfovibrio]MCI7373294.1 HD domain-containing protein [Desulfovibrio piger]MCI7405631.1 HD domain-containing protein [Desulfovibrio piger]MCI7616467.1 HD domain-containing protein [Desulfovibrio piger]MDD6247854.1 HD domain-containing protein [Desulfovibrio piger]MDY4672351.1 HD domain-containing protein [Desulfovibrio sp.]
MQKGIFVKDMAAPNEAEGVFVITLAAQGSSRNGPYWRLVLADASGSVEAKIWSPLSASFPALHTGSFFYAHGRVSTFRDQLQFTVEEGRLLSPEEGAALDLADFMPASPYPLDAMMDELMALIREEFRYKPWRKLVDGVFKNEELREAFRTCPAAKGVHHAYAGGLLEHTLSVFKLCRRLADQYPELDRQTLLAGALFHDFGKIREFSGGIANDYTDEGRLLGHLEICVEMLAPYLEKSGLEPELQRHLKHLVLSHHGTLEFGAVRVPQTAEALVLHYADNIDAKMAQCRGLFAQLGEGESWTPYQATLGRAMHRCAQTPVEEKVEKKPRASRKSSGEDGMLSLL